MSKILVVDDEAEACEALKRFLEMNEYEVCVAMDGKSALEAVESEQPDLILLDVKMPGMDGYEVCRRLKSESKTSDIPIVFLSAITEVENKTKGFELGAVDYITKPFELSEVEARVKTHLSLVIACRKLKHLSSQLSKYVSSEVIQSIMEGKTDATIKTDRKLLSVFFSDIVGFTTKADHLEPEELTILLNKYFDRMASIVKKYNGTLDKFIGDAVMVFFGDPITNGANEDALSCVKMALEMQDKAKDLATDWDDQGLGDPFKIRIGISTGYCTVGNFGSEDQMDYTIIGNNVNAASRLESLATPGGILVSHRTWSLVKEYVEGEEQKPIVVKGFHDPLRVHHVTGLK